MIESENTEQHHPDRDKLEQDKQDVMVCIKSSLHHVYSSREHHMNGMKKDPKL